MTWLLPTLLFVAAMLNAVAAPATTGPGDRPNILWLVSEDNGTFLVVALVLVIGGVIVAGSVVGASGEVARAVVVPLVFAVALHGVDPSRRVVGPRNGGRRLYLMSDHDYRLPVCAPGRNV